MTPDGNLQDGLREEYRRAVAGVRDRFESAAGDPGAGLEAMAARAALVDSLVGRVSGKLDLREVSIVAVGGYGRGELSLHSDVDLLFLVGNACEKHALTGVSQALWDAGLRVSPTVRTVAQCRQVDAENVEGTLALLDARWVAGERVLFSRLVDEVLPELVNREGGRIQDQLRALTAARYARYGGTVFHLEPNIKDAPGGLRDMHVLRWMARLRGELGSDSGGDLDRDLGGARGGERRGNAAGLREAHGFLNCVRWFLHARYRRDNNVLDWPGQEAAAALGLGVSAAGESAERWMRRYFRYAREIANDLEQTMEAGEGVSAGVRVTRLNPGTEGWEIRLGRIEFNPTGVTDAATILGMFAASAGTGLRLSRDAASRVEQALPELSAEIEDGPMLWHLIAAVLKGSYAGVALRAMHALGLLELLIPEFHGIDALVVRDAYHRYTVDEHTFVVVDRLHELERARLDRTVLPEDEAVWPERFGGILRDVANPELLYLAGLLHDTGKARSLETGSSESEQLTRTVVERMELDPFEANLVVTVVRQQAEMVKAMRRDVYDPETVRRLAEQVSTPQELRMLTLFTYADIAAVNPGAMTAWKAEQLWRLFRATLLYLDRTVDTERIRVSADVEAIERLLAILPGREEQVKTFLDGFPARYLLTRTRDEVKIHFLMAEAGMPSGEESLQMHFSYGAEVCELILVTRDRELLYARMAGALAQMGMNIVSSDAFANRRGVVVDSFRFTDQFRTLHLNLGERDSFVVKLREMLADGSLPPAVVKSYARKMAVPVETRIAFDQEASAGSTMLQVITEDRPGLLYGLSRVIAESGCNIEVAIVDTEGGIAIDVFYMTKRGRKLEADAETALRSALLLVVETPDKGRSVAG